MFITFDGKIYKPCSVERANSEAQAGLQIASTTSPDLDAMPLTS